MIILGLGGLNKDAACAVLKDGELVAAVEERKVARYATADALPQAAIGSALEVARLTPADVNCVALVRPFAPQIHLTLRAQFPNAQTLMVEHHAAHAASAYYPSPFDEATVLTLDRDGDFRSAARWRASGHQLQLEKDLYYPDSLGDLYSRVTELLGFNAGSDEHKVQWLSTADSGEQFLPLFEELLGSSDWSRCRLLIRWSRYHTAPPWSPTARRWSRMARSLPWYPHPIPQRSGNRPPSARPASPPGRRVRWRNQ